MLTTIVDTSSAAGTVASRIVRLLSFWLSPVQSYHPFLSELEVKHLSRLPVILKDCYQPDQDLDQAAFTHQRLFDLLPGLFAQGYLPSNPSPSSISFLTFATALMALVLLSMTILGFVPLMPPLGGPEVSLTPIKGTKTSEIEHNAENAIYLKLLFK